MEIGQASVTPGRLDAWPFTSPHESVGLDLSPDMLAEARRKANERGVAVELRQGDMRDFDLGGEFDLIFIAANALLHRHEAAGVCEPISGRERGLQYPCTIRFRRRVGWAQPTSG